MTAVPLRVPPPKADSVVEQWLIDAALHLDDCLDEHKRQVLEKFDELKAVLEDFKATAFSMIASKADDHETLRDRIESHQRFHDEMEALQKALKQQRDNWLAPLRRAIDEAPKVLVAISLFMAGGVGYVMNYLF
jgi:nitric oxide reductase activation protein